MIKNAKIYVLIAVLFFAQACGSKNEKKSERALTKAEDSTSMLSSTLEQRRAIFKKDSAMIAEKRMKAWKDLVAQTPFYTDSKGNIIYHKAEVDPSFIGGNKAMMDYLRNNIVYPQQAKNDELEGTVFIDFVVGLNGAIDNVEVTNATSADVDQAFRKEAVRVVSSMPKWTPGRQNNKAVYVKYSIPITFQII